MWCRKFYIVCNPLWLLGMIWVMIKYECCRYYVDGEEFCPSVGDVVGGSGSEVLPVRVCVVKDYGVENLGASLLVFRGCLVRVVLVGGEELVGEVELSGDGKSVFVSRCVPVGRILSFERVG